MPPRGCCPGWGCPGHAGPAHHRIAALPAEGHCGVWKPRGEGLVLREVHVSHLPSWALSAMLCGLSAEAEPALGGLPLPAITAGTALALLISACPSPKLNWWKGGAAIHRAGRVHADLTFRTAFYSYGDAAFISPRLALLFSIQPEPAAPFFPARAGEQPSQKPSWWSHMSDWSSFPCTHQVLHFCLLLACIHADLGTKHHFRCPGFRAVTLCVSSKWLHAVS